jgi:MFS family permease
MIQAQGYTQLQSGLTFLPFTILMMSIARFAGRLADKYGARKLLIAGPAVAGIGLLMLSFVKQTNGADDYWTSFFPGILVFGLGMSFTVAPLTATVMSAADEHLSGTASGINNAMTRISNVFANAVFGALAVLFFSNALQKDLQETSFNIDIKQSITAQAINLGDAKPPSNIDSNKKPEVEKLYRQGFISSYGKIMQLASGLAFTGALMSLLLIKDRNKETS